MKRDVDALEQQRFDVLVVGGGVHGACVARDAALRGLSVALVEQSDFSSATSHNSLKTIHGGIRYLQHLNLKRAVESIREQAVFLRTAPHLVQPLKFLMPCYGWRMRGPVVTGIGVALFELVGFITRAMGGRKPRGFVGGVFSPSRTLELAPGLDKNTLTGGAMWLDAQVSLADKAVLQMLKQATEYDAVVANYVQATRLVTSENGNRVIGIEALDKLDSSSLSIKAQLVINAAGPWVNSWVSDKFAIADGAGTSGAAATAESAGTVGAADNAQRNNSDILGSLNVGLVKSMNLLVRAPAPPMAFGVKSRRQSDSKLDSANRLFFAVPWQGQTIIGTTHFTHTEQSRKLDYEPDNIASFLAEFNAAYPSLKQGMKLGMDDVLYCYQGLTPGDDAVDADGAKLHHSKVIDHKDSDDVHGLLSIIGIKWTTARRVAEEAVDTAVRHLESGKQCLTRTTFIPDYPQTTHDTGHLSDEQLRAFVLNHVEHTQAAKLSDIVLRRTNDLLLGTLTPARVRLVLNTLSTHFNWSREYQGKEINTVLASGIGPQLRQALIEEFRELCHEYR